MSLIRIIVGDEEEFESILVGPHPEPVHGSRAILGSHPDQIRTLRRRFPEFFKLLPTVYPTPVPTIPPIAAPVPGAPIVAPKIAPVMSPTPPPAQALRENIFIPATSIARSLFRVE
jgi:hypothetical protein